MRGNIRLNWSHCLAAREKVNREKDRGRESEGSRIIQKERLKGRETERHLGGSPIRVAKVERKLENAIWLPKPYQRKKDEGQIIPTGSSQTPETSGGLEKKYPLIKRDKKSKKYIMGYKKKGRGLSRLKEDLREQNSRKVVEKGI